MDREITEGFDTTFAAVGFDFDVMLNLNKVADTVSHALEELHEIMEEKDLYEKYSMTDKFGSSTYVWEEYEKKLADNMENAITMKDDDGNVFHASVINMGEKMAEASLETMTEILQETLGKEYGIEFSYTDIYHDSNLMVGKYEYEEGYITEKVNDALEQRLERQ